MEALSTACKQGENILMRRICDYKFFQFELTPMMTPQKLLKKLTPILEHHDTLDTNHDTRLSLQGCAVLQKGDCEQHTTLHNQWILHTTPSHSL